MRWGIFCDVHANYEALEAVLAAFKRERVDRYLFLGDIVGYGAEPAQCIAEIRRLNPVSIAGNHDRVSCDLFDVNYFNPHAKAAVLWTRQHLSVADKDFLKSLELIHKEDDFILVHGSLQDPQSFDYIVDISSAVETFNLLDKRFCFTGHSHIAGIYIKEGERYTYTTETNVGIKDTQSYIVNAGSVGQPRDGNPKASYVVYDSETRQVQIERVAYDIQGAQDKIIKAGLPRILAERLTLGR
jgi:predicted phosphodiesterase